MSNEYPFRSRFVSLSVDNIDTDQIIPARFLKTTEKAGLGKSAFNDWRYKPDGTPNLDFVFNREEAKGAEILVAGHNFGCGSSREHAPWALLGLGLRAVISSGFADIFKNNSLKNGLIPIEVSPEILAQLHNQTGYITVDLELQTITSSMGTTSSFPIDPFAKHCILNGIDQLGFLIANDALIAQFEEAFGMEADNAR